MTKDKESNHAISNAKAHLEDIVKLHAEHNQAESQNRREAIEDELRDTALSIEVRSGWYSPGCDKDEISPEEFMILLTTGGPALRVTGDLRGDQPDCASLQWQDWGTPWTDYQLTDEEQTELDWFASLFYFGE